MPRHRRKRWDVVIAVLAAAWVVSLWLINEQPWRPTLVVWCCGSNFESQDDFARHFGRAHRCKVLVVGAPVQYLAELAGRGPRCPDLLVGRSGPGWKWLRQRGLLKRGPEFFAIDPYVIMVPKGNPAGVDGPEALSSGITAAIAPHAMRPKGKCIAHLLDAIARVTGNPGLAEVYYAAAEEALKCARLLPRPLKQGRAYVALTQRSQTTHPDASGTEAIEIEPKYMLAMKKCRATVPQCAAVLTRTRHLQLAGAYLDELVSPRAAPILERHGYYHITNEKARPFKPMMKVFVPRKPQPYQDQLAHELMADQQWSQALRRWLKLLHIFGPSPYDAKARYYAGYCALQMGLKRAAWAMWRRCVREYPRKGLHEWGGPFFRMNLALRDPEDIDEKFWADKARQALADLGEVPQEFGYDWEPGEVTDVLLQYPPIRITILESDLLKGSRRNLAVSEDLLQCALYAPALKDYNKVYTLNSPNRWLDMAMFRAGQCAWLLGNKAAALDLWETCKSVYTGQHWADLAGRLLYLASVEGETPVNKTIPADAVRILDSDLFPPTEPTFQARGLLNAYWDFKAANLHGALKECFKVAHAFYRPPRSTADREFTDYRPEARYWAGIVCCWLGKPAAAIFQWRRLIRDHPSHPAAAKARQAIATLRAYPTLTSAQRRRVEMAMNEPLTGGTIVQTIAQPATDARRARIALADGVPDKGASAIWHHIALELFDCEQWAEALHSFLKVLTVVNLSDGKNNRWQAEALYFAGACLRRLGIEQRAQARWRELMQRYPNSPWAAAARQAISSRPGAHS